MKTLLLVAVLGLSACHTGGYRTIDDNIASGAIHEGMSLQAVADVIDWQWTHQDLRTFQTWRGEVSIWNPGQGRHTFTFVDNRLTAWTY